MPSSCDAHSTFFSISALRNALRPQRKGDILAHRVMRIEAVALEHHRHAAGARRNIVDDVAADHEVAARLLLEPADDAQERRLAAARRAEQHHELAVRHRQLMPLTAGTSPNFLTISLVNTAAIEPPGIQANDSRAAARRRATSSLPD